MNTLIVNLRHAAHNHETLHIGGGVFTPTEVKACLREIEDLQATLAFCERWASHHGTKAHVTAEQALSVIQHHPGILAITRSYADGKAPQTFDPYARIAELEAQLAANNPTPSSA